MLFRSTHDAHRVVQVPDRTLSPHNRHLYYNPDNPPQPYGVEALDRQREHFCVL